MPACDALFATIPKVRDAITPIILTHRSAAAPEIHCIACVCGGPPQSAALALVRGRCAASADAQHSEHHHLAHAVRHHFLPDATLSVLSRAT